MPTALITGANRGLGLELTRQYASAGWAVYATVRDPHSAEDLLHTPGDIAAIVGIKNVTINESFFAGHYPGTPIMPGVLVVEAMAQLSGVLIAQKIENTGKLAVLWSIDKVKLRGAVVPGDQIRLEAFTLRLSGGRGRVRCRSTVDGQLVSEARLNFALTEPPS